MIKTILLLLAVCISALVMGQSTANYNFTYGNNGSLHDLSSGSNDMLVPATTTGDFASSIHNIGFDFYFMGSPYSQFSVNSNGAIRLGPVAITFAYSNQLSTTTNTPIITAFWDDLNAVGNQTTTNNTKVRYKVFGVAPYRSLVIEWKDFVLVYNGNTTTATSTFQVCLYENTGVIEYTYGRMQIVSSAAASASIGFSKGNTNNNLLYVTTVNPPTVATLSAGVVNNLFFTNGIGEIQGLNSTADSARTFFRFSPPAPPVLSSGLSFSAVSINSMTLNWDDAQNELGYVIMRSTDSINYTTVATLAANTITYLATALTFGTTYYWKVIAFNEGSGLEMAGTQATVAATICGDKTVGNAPSSDYHSLTEAFNDINLNGLACDVHLILQADYNSSNETFPIVPSLKAAVSTHAVRVFPASTGLVITSANTTGTINLNACHNIIFDGRVNMMGDTKSLVIENTNAGASYAVQFINDATNNTFQYCMLNSANNNLNSGTVVFSTATTTGNDNNLIDSCDIYNGAAYPFNAIYAVGSSNTTALNNSGNIISNNNIYNFFNPGGTDNGVYVSLGNTDWTVAGNSFYQTGTRIYTAGATHCAINISNSSGNNFSIENNFIGGSSSQAQGNAWNIGGNTANRFKAIIIMAGSSVPSNVHGNTIRNFLFASTSNSNSLGGPWCGIYYQNGIVNIGSISGNTIGDDTGTGSIIASISSSGGLSCGIAVEAASSNAIISNNIIGSITTTGTSAIVTHGFTAINITNGYTMTLENNIIGSMTTPNSINAENPSTSTYVQFVIGISNTGLQNFVARNNIIANLNSNYSPTLSMSSPVIKGINSSNGMNTISGNTIYNLSTAANTTGSGLSSSIIGISVTAGSSVNNTISRNTIYGLANNNTSAVVSVTGILYEGSPSGTHVMDRNLIYALSVKSTAATSGIQGIHFHSGLATVKNNVILLGHDIEGIAINNGVEITGLYELAANANSGIYFNSIFIDGLVTGQQSGNSYAFRSGQVQLNRSIQNNIFMNTRSNASTGGKHYAVRVNGAGINPAGLTLNYNDYFVNGNGGVFGFYGNADIPDLISWQMAIGQDANSLSADPLFVAATANPPDLNLSLSTACENAGLAINGINDDFHGAVRANLTPTDIGAIAGNFALSGIDMGVIALLSPSLNGCYTNAEILNVKIKNHAASDIDFSMNPLVIKIQGYGNAQGYADSVILNTGTLNAGLSQNISFPTTLDMLSNGAYLFKAYVTVAGDFNVSNDTLTLPRIANTMAGIYTVGAAANFNTLTEAVMAYNTTACLKGAVTFLLTDTAYLAESLPILINARADASAVNSLTIKPANAVNTYLKGNSTTAVISLNGADYVSIDGSNNGSDSRNLSLQNTNTTGTSVVHVVSLGTGLGSTHITIKNCNISNASNTAQTYGIVMGGSTAGQLGNDNNLLRIQNNVITKSAYGIYLYGLNDSLIITKNIIGSNIASEYVSNIGISIYGGNSPIIKQNEIFNIISAAYHNVVGIEIREYIVNALFEKNNIHDISSNTPGEYSAIGINLSPIVGTNGVRLINNLIYNLHTTNYSASSLFYNPYGIRITGGNGHKLYFNTVHLAGNQFPLGTQGTLSAALLISSNTVIGMDIRNNIFSNGLSGLSGSKSYAVYAVNGTTFSNINHNDYYTYGLYGNDLGFLGAVKTSLADWRLATNKDTNSIAADPLFLSDYNLKPTAEQIFGAGQSISGITTDFFDSIRSNPPDIGAINVLSCSAALGGIAIINGDTALCGPGTPLITASGYSMGFGSTYQWQYSNDNFSADVHDFSGQTNPATLNAGEISVSTFFRLKVQCTTGLAVAYSNTLHITIHPAALVTANPSSANICLGSSVNFIASGTDLYIWSPGNGLNSMNGPNVIASPTETTTYTVIGTVLATGCSDTALVTVIVDPTPSALSISPGNTTLCEGNILQLTANGGTVNGISLLIENFNGPNAWTTVNNSSGGNPSLAAWTMQTDGYVYNSFTFHSNDSSTFYLSNSDSQGSSGTTSTLLISPVINTTDFTSLSFSFWHHYRHYTSPAKVEISLDGGTSWEINPLIAFAGTMGNSDGFNHVSLNLNAYLDQTNLRIRFNYYDSYGFFWAIDNISITGSFPADIVWTPANGLFTDAAATIPYAAGSTASNVYALPLLTTTYTATATSINGCNSADQVSLDVTANVAVSLSITASANPVLSGNMVTFTASPVNAGLSPMYQWFVNGNAVGTNSLSYAYIPVNNDVIFCVLTSDIACVSGNPANSNGITMIVEPVGIQDVNAANTSIYTLDDRLYVQSSAPLKEISVYNSMGQLVFCKACNPTEINVFRLAVAEGIYVARVTSAKAEMSKRFYFNAH